MPKAIDTPAAHRTLEAIEALIHINYSLFILQPDEGKTEIPAENKALFFNTKIKDINQLENQDIMPLPIGASNKTPEENLLKANQLLEFQYTQQFQAIIKSLRSETQTSDEDILGFIKTLKSAVKENIKEEIKRQIRRLMKNQNWSEIENLKKSFQAHVPNLYAEEINIVKIFDQAIQEIMEPPSSNENFTKPAEIKQSTTDPTSILRDAFKGENIGVYDIQLKSQSASNDEIFENVIYIEKEKGTGKIICTLKSPKGDIFIEKLNTAIDPNQSLTLELLRANDYELKGEILIEISRRAETPEDKTIKEKRMLQGILKHTDALANIIETKSILQQDQNKTEIPLENKKQYLSKENMKRHKDFKEVKKPKTTKSISNPKDYQKNLFNALDVAGLLNPPSYSVRLISEIPKNGPPKKGVVYIDLENGETEKDWSIRYLTVSPSGELVYSTIHNSQLDLSRLKTFSVNNIQLVDTLPTTLPKNYTLHVSDEPPKTPEPGTIYLQVDNVFDDLNYTVIDLNNNTVHDDIKLHSLSLPTNTPITEELLNRPDIKAQVLQKISENRHIHDKRTVYIKQSDEKIEYVVGNENGDRIESKLNLYDFFLIPEKQEKTGINLKEALKKAEGLKIQIIEKIAEQGNISIIPFLSQETSLKKEHLHYALVSQILQETSNRGHTHPQYAMQLAFILQQWDNETYEYIPNQEALDDITKLEIEIENLETAAASDNELKALQEKRNALEGLKTLVEENKNFTPPESDPTLDRQFLNIVNRTERTLQESTTQLIRELIQDKNAAEIAEIRNIIETHLNSLDPARVDILRLKAALPNLFSTPQVKRKLHAAQQLATDLAKVLNVPDAQDTLKHINALIYLYQTRRVLLDPTTQGISLEAKEDYLMDHPRFINTETGLPYDDTDLSYAKECILLHAPMMPITQNEILTKDVLINKYYETLREAQQLDPKQGHQYLNISGASELTFKRWQDEIHGRAPLSREAQEQDIMFLYDIDDATTRLIASLQTHINHLIVGKSKPEIADLKRGFEAYINSIDKTHLKTIDVKELFRNAVNAQKYKEEAPAPQLEQSGLIAERQPEQQVFSPQPPPVPNDKPRKALRRNTGVIFDNTELAKQQEALPIQQDEALPQKPSEQLPAKVIRRSPAIFFKDQELQPQALTPTIQPTPQPPIAPKRNLPQRKGGIKQPPNPATDGVLQAGPHPARPLAPGKS